MKLSSNSFMSVEKFRSIDSFSKYGGIAIASSIILAWLINIYIALSSDLTRLNAIEIILLFGCQTFLSTGLFITAHDAMHGQIFERNRRINNFFGKLALSIYALLSYQELCQKHWLHHRYPATELDPDFHDGESDRFFNWYFYFMKGYWSWSRFTTLASIVLIIAYIFKISAINLTLFWMFPLFLSSLQLFYFGTFLTHREPKQGYLNSHRAKTTRLPIFWSFITCYHFGYHQEHHEHPNVPWWKLSSVYLASDRDREKENKIDSEIELVR
jgi:beta-carotene ketolase (CrtW type)